MINEEQWSDFLADQDLVWNRPPRNFYEAPFLGNGGMGASVHLDPEGRVLVVEIGDSRVRDHQSTPDGGGALFGQAQLRVGFFTLETAGEVVGCNLRLSLWDAELKGTVVTTAGILEISAFISAISDILVFCVEPSEVKPVLHGISPPMAPKAPEVISLIQVCRKISSPTPVRCSAWIRAKALAVNRWP